MTVAVANQWGSSRPASRLPNWLERLQPGLPLEAWSPRRRCLMAALIAVTTFGLGAHGWRAFDLGHAAHSQQLLDAAQQRLLDARAAVQRLPELRRDSLAAAASTATATATTGLAATGTHARWSSADDVRIVSQLAAQYGVELLTLEPGAATGHGMDLARPVQMTARADFAGLMGFLSGLDELPVLVVPHEVMLKRDGQGLVLSAVLQVFSALVPAPALAGPASASAANADDDDVILYDPFALFATESGRGSEGLSGHAPLRLAGLLHDARHRLALVETPEGVATVATGQDLGAERVNRIEAYAIALSNRGKRGNSVSERRLTLSEQAP
ncbi:hypothetical protein QS306_02610 [Paraburkholderia bonniea]|uniref:hypothetical protein n=1 Tax=Paraburkholderia bonniea TaxID=2152891 RepID=UPI002573ED4E|nr:hypothetical protein [Paraburkholderia bonniea]WJF90584.1 hypothetical protein QS306_02610 [Paraburkholderia bonniea]WJF93899.1 hypothetical protein QS308_02610 [Paraburkholderia bonniea]